MTIKKGDRSLAVLMLQQKLNAVIGSRLYVDGDYGPSTERAVRKYQASAGLFVDGVAGTKTLVSLDNAVTKKELKQPDKKYVESKPEIAVQGLKEGDRSLTVLALQEKLNTATGAKLSLDGDYGPATTRAVREYQASVGLVADGVAGAKTLALLDKPGTQNILIQPDDCAAVNLSTSTKGLKEGDRSLAVLVLQQKLNTVINAKLYADGDYGPATTRAVHKYQASIGLVADGVAGVKTLASLDSVDTKKMLKQCDITRAATELGVNTAAVMAVNQVESRGSGFFDNRPIILYERHVFRRQLLKNGLKQAEVKKLELKHADIINSRPGGYIGGVSEYQKLDRAIAIHRTAALESCSWGAFQIMGYHWETMGYASIEQFVERMYISEGEQLDAFVRFIKADSRLHKALKEQQWAEFARRYNGPGYAKNLYDVKMARAYEQFTVLEKEEPA